MTGKSKRKGDNFERLCATYLTDNTKYRVTRKFGAGMAEDRGDLEGIAGMIIQAADWQDKSAVLYQKPPQADQQASRVSDGTIGVTACKLRGGDMRFIFTAEAFCKLVNEHF